mmetsp:Transcript_60195/g.127508  ORF Transcript_60195/g.127508 Transcript_60195/m.127508 type:complete len:263 (+) Transcript_60195:127-915(+)
MVDPQAVEFFAMQFEREPENRRCFDSGSEIAEWASVSHGIYLSIGASGIHRSLGVKVSFVQSTTMDSWKPLHLRMMELGGNRRFAEFLRKQGVPEDMPLRQKYRTRAAEWYRRNLRAEAEGSPLPDPLEDGVGSLLMDDAQDSSQSALLDNIFNVTQIRAPGAYTPSSSSQIPHLARGTVHTTPLAVHRYPSQCSPRSPALPDWIASGLDWMTLSPGSHRAERLRTMSTGNMPGFGAADVVQDRFGTSEETMRLNRRAIVNA